MNININRKEARYVVRTLRSGAVTPQAARIITVGTQNVEQEFRQAVLDLSARGITNGCLFIKGDWGCGKSHMRMLFTEHLNNLDFPFIDESVDGRANSLAHLHRCVPHWLGQMHVRGIAGLRNLFDKGMLDWRRAVDWCRTRDDVFASNLHHALRGWAYGWYNAVGHQYHTPDYSYQHPKARDLFFSAMDFVSLNRGGVVLLLDEVENVSRQYDIRGRKKSYDTLGRLMVHPRIMPLLFVTERFFHQVSEDRIRGSYNGLASWTDFARTFVDNVSLSKIMSPPIITDLMAEELVDKVVRLYEAGYQLECKPFPTSQILAMWKRTSTRPVRLLVRMTVHQLDLMRLYR